METGAHAYWPTDKLRKTQKMRRDKMKGNKMKQDKRTQDDKIDKIKMTQYEIS